jgi:hypothetical protein
MNKNTLIAWMCCAASLLAAFGFAWALRHSQRELATVARQAERLAAADQLLEAAEMIHAMAQTRDARAQQYEAQAKLRFDSINEDVHRTMDERLLAVYPTLKPFTSNRIPGLLPDGQQHPVLEAVEISGSRAMFIYHNTTKKAAHPTVDLRLYDAHGIAIATASDSWSLDTVGIGERRIEDTSLIPAFKRLGDPPAPRYYTLIIED